MSNIVSDDIARMVHLYSYKSNTSSSNKPSSVVEYHEVGADGKTYGILKEGTKYYIKVAPVKDTKIVAEDYDYIGGITNKKRYEYDSYSNAYKQFDLKMMSINEAFNNVYDDVETKTKPEQSEWQIQETKEMRAELDRYNRIVENVDKILTEGTNAKRPKVGNGAEIGSPTSQKAKNGNPFKKKASKEMNQKTGSCKNAECADDTFDETPMTQEKINKMGENEKFTGKDKTYSKTAKVDKKKMNEQTALCSRENPDYMDLSHGTHKGSSAPYCDGKSCSCDDDNLFEDECFDDDNLNNPKPGTGCAKCKTNPWNKKVNEETILPDEAAGFEAEDNELENDYNDDIPFGVEDDDFTSERIEGDEFSDEYDTDTEDISIEGDDEDELDSEEEPEEEDLTDDEDELEDDEDELEADEDEFEADEDEFEADEDEFEADEDEFEADEDEFDPMDNECLNEGMIDYWGKHPAYLKSPFTLPDDIDIDKWGRDWNDNSAKGGKYGKSKGKSSPYDEDLLVDNIVNKILKKKTLEERKVLKVPNNNMDDGMPDDLNNTDVPSFDDTQQPPMDRGMDDNPEDEKLGMDSISGGEDNGDMDNFSSDVDGEEEKYDNDFDAGVDASEEEDPEKYLQQLTGKLCDKLKKFNEEKPKPDVGMCKYIAGMVLAQCVKGLDEKEKDEILSKLTKSDKDSDNDYEQNDDSENVDSYDNDGFGDDLSNKEGSSTEKEEENNELNETKKIVERIVQNVKKDIMNPKPKGTTNKRKSYRMTPYLTPEFV